MAAIISDLFGPIKNLRQERLGSRDYEELKKRAKPLAQTILRIFVAAVIYYSIQKSLDSPSRKKELLSKFGFCGGLALITIKISKTVSGGALFAGGGVVAREGFRFLAHANAKSAISIPLLLIAWQLIERGYHQQKEIDDKATYFDQKFLDLSKILARFIPYIV